jgi:hypothetical protein
MSIENVTAQLYLQEGNFNLLLQKRYWLARHLRSQFSCYWKEPIFCRPTVCSLQAVQVSWNRFPAETRVEKAKEPFLMPIVANYHFFQPSFSPLRTCQSQTDGFESTKVDHFFLKPWRQAG